jgi:hypothetical protein
VRRPKGTSHNTALQVPEKASRKIPIKNVGDISLRTVLFTITRVVRKCGSSLGYQCSNAICR